MMEYKDSRSNQIKSNEFTERQVRGQDHFGDASQYHRSLSVHHPCLSRPPFPYTTYHLQISAFRDPIISLLTFHMPKPSQPATPNNFLHALNTQPKPELLTRSSVLQGHSRHPSNHNIFRSQKPLHIIHLHRPSFATIHKHPLYTHSIYLSLHSQ